MLQQLYDMYSATEPVLNVLILLPSLPPPSLRTGVGTDVRAIS